MQERHFNELYSALGQKNIDELFADKMEAKIAKQTVNIPLGMRTPVAAEIEDIINWMKEFKKRNPRTSKRQLRIETKKYFNITTVPNAH